MIEDPDPASRFADVCPHETLGRQPPTRSHGMLPVLLVALTLISGCVTCGGSAVHWIGLL